MAKTNFEKKFYSKIFKAIDRDDKDGFYKEFSNAIKSGKMAIDYKRSRSQLSFDSTWIEVITKYMQNLERIVRNPKAYMNAEDEVVGVQKVKKITSRSVQHLASHVQNVQNIEEDGSVTPHKVLTTTYDDTLNIYENRFIMTLINKLAAFIEVRYNAVINESDSYLTDSITMSDAYEWRGHKIKAQIALEVKEPINDEVSQRNKDLLARIVQLRTFTRGFITSQFYVNMKTYHVKPVTPPILRTNIIVKHVDYSSCLKLWQFLDGYRQLGVDTGVFTKDLAFDESFIDDICDMVLVNYSLVAKNQEDRADKYEMLPYKYHVLKSPKLNRGEAGQLLTVVEALEEAPTKEEMAALDDPSISEYFYQRIKANYKQSYTRQVNSGISANKSFLNVFRKMQKIENGVSKEIIDGLEKKIKAENPTRTPKAVRSAFLRKQRSIYKQVLLAKTQDIEKLQQKLDTIDEELERRESKEKKK